MTEVTERMAPRVDVVLALVDAMLEAAVGEVDDVTDNEVVSAIMTLTGSTVASLVQHGSDLAQIEIALEMMLATCRQQPETAALFATLNFGGTKH